MDYSIAYSLSQFGIEDPNFILPNNIVNPIHDDTDFESLYFGSYSNCEPSLNQQSLEGETLMIKTAYENLCSSNQMITTNASTSTSTNFIAFGYPNSIPLEEHYDVGSDRDEAMPQHIFDFSSGPSQASSHTHCYASVFGDQEMKIENSTMNKSPLQVQQHVVAERLRRQKLNKLFIGLSAHIPGLKKLDKASILKDAAEYIKQLQEHSKVLEEEAGKQLGKPTLPKKIRMTEDIDKSDCQSSALISDIKARVCDGEILIRIHCKKPKQVTLKILGELEKLHLTIINCSVVPFDESHDITIIAQRNVECGIPRKELLENVKSAILKLV